MSRVVVIGAGAVGCAAALHLKTADPGLDVVVVEPDYTYAWAATGKGTGGVRQLFTRRKGMDSLTPREREVLDLMARGLSNSAICAALVLAPVSVEKHITNIFTKLDLPLGVDDHRRVLAVLAWLRV